MSCPRCDQPMDPATAAFDREGTWVCEACANRDQIDGAEHRAAMAILGPAIGGVMTAIASFFINPFFIVSILAIASSVGAVLTLVRHPEYRQRMGWRVPATWGFGCLGVLLALIPARLALMGLVVLFD